MNSAVYSIRSPSGKLYVGSSASIGQRWKRHLRYLRTNQHFNYKLQRAADKYGVDKLKFSILLFCRPSDLIFYEQRAIDILKPVYNICTTAGSTVGLKMPEKTRVKMRNSHLGKKHSLECKAAIGRAHKGKTMTEESRAKMSESAKRRDRQAGYSKEHRAAIQAGVKAFWDERRMNGLPLCHPRPRKGAKR